MQLHGGVSLEHQGGRVGVLPWVMHPYDLATLEHYGGGGGPLGYVPL